MPTTTQRQEDGHNRLKRVILIGDHHQLPPVVKNMAIQQYRWARAVEEVGVAGGCVSRLGAVADWVQRSAGLEAWPAAYATMHALLHLQP